MKNTIQVLSKRFGAVVLLAGLVCLYPPKGVGEPLEIELKAGISYEKIRGARSTYRDGIVEVEEFFWYGCPHCYALLTPLQRWEKNLFEDVSFEPIAMPGSARWTLDAKVFYTALALGLPSDFHNKYFYARHGYEPRKRPESIEATADFFAENFGEEFDFDSDKFLQIMDSFSVASQTAAAGRLAKKYGVTSVPELVVDGRFRTNRAMAGSYEGMLEVVDQLIELVRLENQVDTDERQNRRVDPPPTE